MNIGEQNLFIGGQWTPSESGETYESQDPFTGKTATRAASATVADVDRAVGAAQDAFGPWAALPPSERRQYVLAAADAVEARASELSDAITTEMGGGPPPGANTTSRFWRISSGSPLALRIRA